MNKFIAITLAAAVFAVGGLAGSWMGAKSSDELQIKSGTAVYDDPTASAEHKMLAKSLSVTVLEKVKYGAATMVYVNDDLTAEADDGEKYRVKKGSYFKFIGVNEAEDIVTVFADTEDGHKVHLELPKQKVYPVDEGEWLKVKDSSIGEKWVRIKSSWYDNI